MYQSERTNEILRILKKYNYVTVNYLVEQINYSPASIRRDLTILENKGLVKRSYGGVSLKAEASTPFIFRQHSMKIVKNSIAVQGAKLINDNDTIFIDGSSSAQYLGPYLLDKKGITVITNNMTLAGFLGDNGTKVYCTGGYISEHPGILAGEITNNTFSEMHADIMFFSSKGYSDGIIFASGELYLRQYRIMLQNADKSVFLCGSDKINQKYAWKVSDLSSIDYFITDAKLDKSEIEKHENTEFIFV